MEMRRASRRVGRKGERAAGEVLRGMTGGDGAVSGGEGLRFVDIMIWVFW